jgi:hypothetical protein
MTRREYDKKMVWNRRRKKTNLSRTDRTQGLNEVGVILYVHFQLDD